MKKVVLLLMVVTGFAFAGEKVDQAAALAHFSEAKLSQKIQFTLTFAERFQLTEETTEDLINLITDSDGDIEAFKTGFEQLFPRGRFVFETRDKCFGYMCYGPGYPNGVPMNLDFWSAAWLCAFLTGGQGALVPIC
ncbi:hypothetical protein [Acanthopleuribacter pedis]|uniref:Uncharacterized protein n=1 Tax=Acanthopleuribacter pedis TaxID=442870 RepID=A0A8J7QMA6_9BACT|nr:hypothetical protein [Acanthopleuribacter pedis]MBO1320605.1 hypothetical protein [Acanthopleuribacter pedis]